MMAVRTIEKIISVDAWRVDEAAQRLERLRGISDAMMKLIARMTVKKGVWNMVAKTQGKQFTFTDYGPST